MADDSSRNPIDSSFQSNDPRFLVSAGVTLGGLAPEDTTVKEVIVGESLLNPSAHVAVTLQSVIYSNRLKNWDATKGQTLGLSISDNSNSNRQMTINMTTYRCDNRRFSTLNTAQTEELTLHGIDNSILEDARTIMSKSYKCQTPDVIVRDALSRIGVNHYYIENCGPARDYIAESIHPFQVIQQQCNAALASGDDPSFLHYMTIDGFGRNMHNFRPLSSLIKQTPGYKIYASDTAISGGTSFSDGFNIAITYNFPCDFDILSDILNGIGPQGQNLNAVKTSNYVNAAFDIVGAISGGNAANIFQAMTNFGTAKKQGTGCESEIEKWLLKRQARMGLLEKDKIALRITVPWSPWLHAGNVFNFVWKNRYDENEVYGSGNYLIVHMTHNIQFGGFATTTLDCIANTLGG
jgi:hypothetical protein